MELIVEKVYINIHLTYVNKECKMFFFENINHTNDCKKHHTRRITHKKYDDSSGDDDWALRGWKIKIIKDHQCQVLPPNSIS